MDNGADEGLDHVLDWGKNFTTSFTDIGVICEFEARITWDYWFTTKYTVELDIIKLTRSWESHPIEYEKGTPNGKKVWPGMGYGECTKIQW